MIRTAQWGTLLLVLLGSAVAQAQGLGRMKRLPGRPGRGGGEVEATMHLTKSSVFVIRENQLVRLDRKTLEEKAKVDLLEVIEKQQPEKEEGEIDEAKQRLLERFDTDGDQVISRTEVDPRMWMRLQRMDEDGDQKLTLDELPTMQRPLLPRGSKTVLEADDGEVFLMIGPYVLKLAEEDLAVKQVTKLAEPEREEEGPPMDARKKAARRDRRTGREPAAPKDAPAPKTPRDPGTF